MKWAVCYGVNGGALMFGRIVSENNGVVEIEDPGRTVGDNRSSWGQGYVERFESQSKAQEAFSLGYRK